MFTLQHIFPWDNGKTLQIPSLLTYLNMLCVGGGELGRKKKEAIISSVALILLSQICCEIAWSSTCVCLQ